MRTASLARPILLPCLFLLFCLTATSAEFSQRLERELKTAQPGEFASAILLLPNAVDIRELDLELHAQKAPLAERHRTVIDALHYNAELAQPAILLELETARQSGIVEGFTPYWIENLIVISARADFLESLRTRGDLDFVTENFKAELIEPVGPRSSTGSRPAHGTLDEQTTPGQDAIGTTRVNRELGITGQGVLVANLDTGVDGSHPALASRWRGNFASPSEAWLDVLGTSNFPYDSDSHGTHVMGSITGREISGGDTTTVGGAPDAQWIACNAIGQGVGNPFDNDVIAAYQWFIDPDNDPGTLQDVPDVVQNSWGVADFFPGYNECDERWNTFILNLEAAGTVVTWSAGNEGPNSSTLRTPANYSMSAVQIFSVGAVSVTNPQTPSYSIASFSSRGPTPCANAQPDNIKPEVSAPGVEVYSSVPGGGYESSGWSGTSMAGPHVAGVVALMRQACPDCDPITIKEALLATAFDVNGGGEDNTYGYGVVDAYEAVTMVSALGWIAGTISSSESVLSGVSLEVLGESYAATTNELGYYMMALPAGSYDVVASRFGYEELTTNGVEVTEGDTTYLDLELVRRASGILSGFVYSSSYDPVPAATIRVENHPVDPVIADANGSYEITLPLDYTFDLRAQGMTDASADYSLTMTGDASHLFVIPGVLECFDFESPQGWTVGAPDDDASTGIWTCGIPAATFSGSVMVQPGSDHTPDPGVACWATDGQNANLTASDVDDGKTTLFSPVWDLGDYESILLSVWTWYSNDEGASPGEDEFKIEITSDGVVWFPLLQTSDNWEYWRQDNFRLNEFVSLSDQVQLRVVAADEAPGSLVEAALDDVCLFIETSALLSPEHLTASPNTAGEIELHWSPVPAVESYRVFRSYDAPLTLENGTIIGTTSDTTFVDTNGSDRGFYFVVAVP